MCGIVGKFMYGNTPVDRDEIRRMANTIIYRGPDDEGIYTAPGIGLGQRRLSIIDLARESTAPLSNEDGTIWVVFNGEIYNYQTLRNDLQQQGHEFRTASDTEVIVHLYEQYGPECLQYMNGMFAFAVWDSVKQTLFAARDRLGKKPFVYANTGRSLVFGSEIKAVTADNSVTIEPNMVAIDCYLGLKYVPSPLTAFTGISRLPPAHYLLCDRNGNLQTVRYWEPGVAGVSGRDRKELESGLMELLRDSVRLRMVSDVPLGAFLSGGIDSCAIVALMAMESDRPVKTFSIGFKEDSFNELPYARLLANRYGTEHHEYTIEPDAIEVLPLLVHHYNEPFADASSIPTYYVSKVTRENVTVALSGDGGDESFAGYSHYKNMLQWAWVDHFPEAMRYILTRPFESLFRPLNGIKSLAKLSKGMRMAGSGLPERYRQYMSIIKDQEKDLLYSRGFKDLLENDISCSMFWHVAWDKSVNQLDWMMRHDLTHYLPDCLMVKTDIASMANSLEVRCPFLDYRLVEYAAGIPPDMKLNGGSKMILRSAVSNLIPEQILTKRKTGFGIPLSSWFRGDLADTLRAVLLGDRIRKRGMFDTRYLERMVTDHISGRYDWSNRLWSLLFLELWFQEFID